MILMFPYERTQRTDLLKPRLTSLLLQHFSVLYTLALCSNKVKKKNVCHSSRILFFIRIIKKHIRYTHIGSEHIRQVKSVLSCRLRR